MSETLQTLRRLDERMRLLEAERDQLLHALERAVSFAEEGWGYASEYFREKWDYDGEIAALRNVVALRTGERP